MLISFGLDARSSRHLEHGGMLAVAQRREQHDLPVRKPQCVMMHAGLIHVDLAETCDPLSDLLGWEDRDDGGLAFDGVVEGKLGARQKAHGNARFSNGGESACNRVVELGCYQPVFDFGGTRGDIMQTVVAHRTCSFYYLRTAGMVVRLPAADQVLVAIFCWR